MGKLSRDKGKRTEREFCRIARGIWPHIERNFRQEAYSDGRDFTGTPGFCVQAKSGKLPPWRKGLDEAAEAAELLEMPVCVTRRDGERWVAHMAFEDFKVLVSAAKAGNR